MGFALCREKTLRGRSYMEKKSEYVEIQGAVNDRFNPYKEIIRLYGREERETNIPSPYGAVSLREWTNGIVITRAAKYDWSKRIHVLEDSATIPRKKEFSGLIERLKKARGWDEK
jgi:hypothetical protein